MSTIPQTELQARLFAIASRARPVHDLPGVLRPEALHAIEPAQLFRNDRPRQRVLELGAGWGEFLCDWLRRRPEDDYLAIEIKGDRIRRTLRDLARLPGPARWLRILPINLNWFLEELLPPESFDWMIVNFPDPWPKRRHWKHRLVRGDFADKASRLLRSGGRVHLATDYAPYARRMLALFRRCAAFEPEFDPPGFRRLRPEDLGPTRFESMTGLKRPAYYLRFRKLR
ncbi:MAG: hypothetical protein K1X75_07970 [Leptospirales bacterium]|nr:hypothetical protein [Leptospirales bacterium]